jgi:hypothetical protein
MEEMVLTVVVMSQAAVVVGESLCFMALWARLLLRIYLLLRG